MSKTEHYCEVYYSKTLFLCFSSRFSFRLSILLSSVKPVRFNIPDPCQKSHFGEVWRVILMNSKKDRMLLHRVFGIIV